MVHNSFPIADAFSTELAAVAGPGSVRREEAGVSVFATEVAQIARIMHFADERRLPVHLQGSGTMKRVNTPTSRGISIRTERLNQLKEHVWQDMTCTVDAGMRWSSMQAQLMQHGQFVALDPLWPDKATVGGIIASNDSGALRLKFGALRDLVIGMTLVLADGTVAKSGGKVVKNVAGYDLNKLMIGSFGTLGVIVEVTFRLHSIPRNVHTFSIPSTDPAPLGKLLLEVLGSQLSLQSMQLRSLPGGFSLDVCLSTLPAVLRQQQTELARMAEAHTLSSQDAELNVWGAREAQFEAAGVNGVVVKASMLPSVIARFTNLVHALEGSSVTQAGGLMTAGFRGITAETLMEFGEELESEGGSLTILRHPEQADGLMCGTASRILPVMQRIKRQFDPNGILDPAVFLEGR